MNDLCCGVFAHDVMGKGSGKEKRELQEIKRQIYMMLSTRTKKHVSPHHWWCLWLFAPVQFNCAHDHDLQLQYERLTADYEPT